MIKAHAVAINPVDWQVTDKASLIYPWIKFPFILGTDVAGEVVEVGSAVSRFQVGDRVLSHAVGLTKVENTATKSAFQTYPVLVEHMTSKLPENLSYEAAAVIPLGLSTAACGLFQKDQLALKSPAVDAVPTKQTLLIWGGSTSVGCNAIQLAVASGYNVITTCSPKNFEYVRSLGASQVFDYNSKTVVADVIKALKGGTIAGALSIGAGAADACLDILPKCKGNKFLSMATYPVPPETTSTAATVLTFLPWVVAANFKAKMRGVRMKFIFADTLKDNGVGEMVYQDFLPQALARGTFTAAPEPHVVGNGLETIIKAFDIQKKGVSAKKIVVSL